MAVGIIGVTVVELNNYVEVLCGILWCGYEYLSVHTYADTEFQKFATLYVCLSNYTLRVMVVSPEV